jgi:hypothetical protein
MLFYPGISLPALMHWWSERQTQVYVIVLAEGDGGVDKPPTICKRLYSIKVREAAVVVAITVPSSSCCWTKDEIVEL